MIYKHCKQQIKEHFGQKENKFYIFSILFIIVF